MKLFLGIFFFLFLSVIIACCWLYFRAPFFAVHGITHTTTQPHRLDEPFEIIFPTPIDKNAFTMPMVITPHASLNATLSPDKKIIQFRPRTLWAPDTTYTITLPPGQTKNFRPIRQGRFTFHTEKPPRIITTIPRDQERDVVVDHDHPITIRFDTPLDHFVPNFSLTPFHKFTSEMSDDHMTYTLRPETPLLASQTYTLTITRTLPHTTYKQKSAVTFTTLPPTPQHWAQDTKERIKQAIRYTRPRITTGKYIDINLSNQIMTTFDNGKRIGTYLISSGRYGLTTPIGTHKIHNKALRPYSRRYGLYMPHWMAFSPDGAYGIHELPEWPGGYKEGQNHLGIPVSHGCVRLGTGASQRVYEWADIGTPVIVYAT